MKKYFFAFLLIMITPVYALFAQQDTTFQQEIYSWKPNQFLEKKKTIIDSTWYTLHQFDPARGNIYLSSYGTAMQHNLFHLRRDDYFVFENPYTDYTLTPQSIQYYRTTTPFTYFNYNSGGGSDKIAEVSGFHTQNVNQYLNVGFKIKTHSSSRFYEPDDNKTLRSFFFTLFGSYNRKNYDAYFNLHSNTIRNDEIGGIADKTDFENGLLEIFTTHLNNSNSVLKGRSFHFAQRIDLLGNLFQKNEDEKPVQDSIVNDSVNVAHDSISKFKGEISNGDKQTFTDLFYDTTHQQLSILHKLTYEAKHYKYLEETFMADFYSTQPVYLDSNETNDNTESFNLDNKFYLSWQSEKFKFNAGINYQLLRFSTIESYYPGDTIIIEDKPKQTYFNNTQLLSDLKILYSEDLYLEADGGYYFTGFNQGDFHLNGKIHARFDSTYLSVGARLITREPHYYYQYYNSNHFQWEHSFDKTTRLETDVKFSIPSFHLELGVHAGFINDMVYMGYGANPVQHPSEIAFATISLKKDLTFWKFRLSNNLFYQYTNNRKVLNIPEYYVKETLAFRHVFHFGLTGGKLHTQLGLNMYYYPEYYADAYMPALNMFYNQEEQKIGGRAIISAFANFKIKRTSLFIKTFHVNSLIQERDYYAAPDYPMSPLMIKFGVFWSFYD